MKVSALFKIIVREFRKDIVISILLLILIDFIYANFTGIRLERENGMILWLGGNVGDLLSVSTVLLKLLNISVVFSIVGKIADKISSDIMIYILARITDYRKFIYVYSVIMIMTGEMLLTVSHIVYYCFAGLYPEQAAMSFLYLFVDALGFFGMMMIYMILNHCYLLENSFMYILAVYLLNMVLPVPILPAMSIVRFIILTNRISIRWLLLWIVGMDLIVAAFYYVLMKKRRVNLC